jgi:hypothetical protein
MAVRLYNGKMDKRHHKRKFSIKYFQVHSLVLLSGTSIYNLDLAVLDNISADQITSVTKQKNNRKPFVLILFFILNLAVAKNLHVCQVTDVGQGGHLHQACG